MKYRFSSCGSLLSVILHLVISSAVHGQTPGNPSVNIVVSEDFTTVGATEQTYNAARRAEEADFMMESGTIDDLDLPDQSTWDSWGLDKQILYLINDERSARNGINYGDGPVKGNRLLGVEQNVDGVAQLYADYLRTNDLFGHFEDGTPSERIEEGVGASCLESNLSYVESLENRATSGASIPNVAEFAIFRFVYQDAHSWGHRMSVLSQMYQDNFGPDSKEGFVGIGYSEGPYDYFEGFDYGMVLVLNFFDPVADENVGDCDYSFVVDDAEFDNIGCPSTIVVDDLMVSGEILASGLVTTSGSVTIDAPTVFSGSEVALNAGFSVPGGYCFEVSLEGCHYFGPIVCEGELAQGCADPYQITCGQVFQGNNDNGSNVWEEYAHGSAIGYNGPETIHMVTIPSLGVRNILLSGLSSNLDLFVASTCDRNAILASSITANSSDESVMLHNDGDGDKQFYIIVDGYHDATSAYTLTCSEPAAAGQ